MTASQTDFLSVYAEGFAQLLAAADVGFSWRTLGAGAPIKLVDRPTNPDAILAITPIPMDAHPVYTDSRVDLQLWFRGGEDMRSVWAMRAAARSVLSGRFPMRLPTGLYVSTLGYSYGSSMGFDDSQRAQWADTYRTRVSEPRTG